jgi:hypothetical protein
MTGHHKKLVEVLKQNGWELVETRETDHRWFVEMWLIRSHWSPIDCHIFFTFETDPQSYKPAGKLAAYNIVASLRKPADWLEDSKKQFEKNEPFDDRTYLFLGRNIEKKIPEFLNDLANLRQKFYNFYN